MHITGNLRDAREEVEEGQSGPTMKVNWEAPWKSLARDTWVLNPARRFLFIVESGPYFQLTAFWLAMNQVRRKKIEISELPTYVRHHIQRLVDFMVLVEEVVQMIDRAPSSWHQNYND